MNYIWCYDSHTQFSNSNRSKELRVWASILGLRPSQTPTQWIPLELFSNGRAGSQLNIQPSLRMRGLESLQDIISNLKLYHLSHFCPKSSGIFFASIGSRLQARLEPETHNRAADYFALLGISCKQIISFLAYYVKKHEEMWPRATRQGFWKVCAKHKGFIVHIMKSH